MSDTIRVYVNEVAVSAPAGALIIDAIRVYSAEAATALEQGRGHVTDGTGRAVSLDHPLTAGSILRVVGARPTRTDDPG
jgi:hypothetical protein